jgi:hypothetical protein
MPEFQVRPTYEGEQLALWSDRELAEDSRDETDPITDWPEGTSIMKASAASDWNGYGVDATVITNRTGTTGFQFVFFHLDTINGSLAQRMWDGMLPGWLDYEFLAKDSYVAYVEGLITDHASSGDHDSRYVNESDHDKAAHDALNIDADTLDGISSTGFVQTGDYEDSDVLAKVKNVDGAGSGLDADTVDGIQASSFLQSAYYQTVKEGGTARTQRAAINFGNGLDATDDAGNNETDVVVDESELTHNSLGGLTTGNPHTQYVLGTDYEDADVLAKILNVDGPGSGLNADLLDGVNSTGFVQTGDYEDSDVLAKLLNVDGSSSGLDADLLDGSHASAFQLLSGKDAASGYVGRDANGGADLNYLKFDRQSSAPATPGDPGANIYTYSQDGITVLEGRTETGGIFRFLRDQADIGYNSTGSTITKGSLVRVTGWDGTRLEPTIALADNSALSTMHAAGMATADIPNNTSGRLWSIGNVSSLNTTGLAVGATLYLGTGGAYTTTAPSAVGTYVQILGEVLVADATTGMVRLAISPSYTTNAAGGSVSLTEVEKNLGTTPRRTGKFNITSSGLTTGKHILITQANGPYTGKGTLTDEAEMDAITATGKVTSATNIECYWRSPTKVRGNVKFAYAVG